MVVGRQGSAVGSVSREVQNPKTRKGVTLLVVSVKVVVGEPCLENPRVGGSSPPQATKIHFLNQGLRSESG